MIKKYMLRKNSSSIDLRPFAKYIIAGYQKYCNTVEVYVYEHYYLLKGYISRSQIINAGIDIAKSPLGQYAIYYPINPTPSQRYHRYLFIGKYVKKPVSHIYYKTNKAYKGGVLI